jgi:hypothetical protein
MWPAVGFLIKPGTGVHPSDGGSDPGNGILANSGQLCTGTLVGRRTVLTSAHCFAGLNDPCHPCVGSGCYLNFSFAFNASGNADLDGGSPGLTQVYAIQDIRIAPHAWDFEDTTWPGPYNPGPLQVCDAGSDAAYPPDLAARFWVDPAQDQALLYLAVGPNQPEPVDVINSQVDGGAEGSAPLQMITSYEDDAFSPFGLHVTGVGDGDGGEPDAGVVPWEVGWSGLDAPPHPVGGPFNGQRGAGPVEFVQPATYGPFLSSPVVLPTPESEALVTGAYVFYKNSIAASPSVGDSGGPAALHSDGTGALPLGNYVLGNLTNTLGVPTAVLHDSERKGLFVRGESC